MGEIALEPGETEKVVSQPGADDAYNIGVSGADVWLSHNESRARQDGQRVRPGDRVTVDNLRGKPLYVKNPPENSDDATVSVNPAGFNLIFQPRAVQASVQASETNEAAPRTDDFVHRHATGADPSSTVTETFDAPGRADLVTVHTDDADASFDVEVRFLDPADDSVITARTPNENSNLEGSSTTQVFTRVAIASPRVEVRLTGAATSVDYSIYAR